MVTRVRSGPARVASSDHQVSVARIGTTLVAGAVAVGVVEVDGTRAQVIIEPRDHALESTVTQYPSELGAITRRRESEDDVQRAIRNRTTETSR
jgi:hypothetical protein